MIIYDKNGKKRFELTKDTIDAIVAIVLFACITATLLKL